MGKKILSCLLTLSILVGICPVMAIGSSRSEDLTPEDVLQAIENGTAKVTFSTLDIDDLTQEQINSDPGLQSIIEDLNIVKTRSINSDLVKGVLYRTTVEMSGSGDIFVHTSTPIAAIEVVDVGTAGSSNINTELYVSESVTWNGELTDYWPNYIHYTDISVKLACGENTIFTAPVEVHGTDENGDSINVPAIFAFLSDVLQYPVISDLISFLSDLIIPGTGSSTTVTKDSEDKTAIGARWGADITLSEEEELLGIYSDISVLDSGLRKNVETVSLAEWEFDVYYSAPIATSPRYTNVHLRPNTNYLTNVK